MRTSKAQLEAENDELKTKLAEVLAEQLRDRKHHREQIEALASYSFPASWYIADNSPGKPVCFGGDGNGDGLSVQVFLDGDYVVGVLLTNGVDTVGGAGLVPYGYND